MAIDSNAAAVALLTQTEPATPEQFDALRNWVTGMHGSDALKWMLDNSDAMAAFRERNDVMLTKYYGKIY